MKKIFVFLSLVSFSSCLQLDSDDSVKAEDELIQKFNTAKSSALALTLAKGLDTLHNLLNDLDPAFGTANEDGNFYIHTTSSRPSKVLFIFTDKESLLRIGCPINEGTDGKPRMMYRSKEIYINGDSTETIFADEDIFATVSSRYNAYGVIHELVHLIQEKLRSVTLDNNISGEIEAYTFELKLFTDNLTPDQKDTWNSMVDNVRSLKSIDKMLDPKYYTKYLPLCEEEFGDMNCVNFLVVSAVTPELYVKKFYKRIGK